jgi:uncharacterized membrane protein
MTDSAELRPARAATDTDLVEYLVVVVRDLDSLGTVVPALTELVASEAIRILDLVCVTKSTEGELTVKEFEQVEGMSALERVEGEVGGLLTTRDIETASRRLDAGSSAMLLVVEDRWAERLSAAAREAGGRVVGGGRISSPVADAALRATYRTTVTDVAQEVGE